MRISALLLLVIAAKTATAQNTGAAACKQHPSASSSAHYSMAYRYQPTAPLDPQWAQAVFDSVASQWNRPHYRHERTDLTFTMRRDSALKTYHVLRSSGEKDFDLLAIRALALAAVNHKIPAVPANYLGDSVVFVVMFGDLDAYMDSVSASNDRQVARPWGTNPAVKWPTGYTVTGGTVPVLAEFDIDSTGVVDLSTIKITSAPNDDFAAAVRTAIPTWRFSPALVTAVQSARRTTSSKPSGRSVPH